GLARHGVYREPSARVGRNPDRAAVGAGRRSLPDRDRQPAEGVVAARRGPHPVRQGPPLPAGRPRAGPGARDSRIPGSHGGKQAVNFVTPAGEELSYLRADPLLWEQELDARPDVSEAIERVAGLRGGQIYWRSAHDHLYSMELADLGRGRPAAAMVYGHWDRYEPRPPEHEITADLLALAIWVAEIAEGLNPADIVKVAHFAGVKPGWPENSVLRTPDERFADL